MKERRKEGPGQEGRKERTNVSMNEEMEEKEEKKK